MLDLAQYCRNDMGSKCAWVSVPMFGDLECWSRVADLGISLHCCILLESII